MTTTPTEPIDTNWTPCDATGTPAPVAGASVSDVCDLLARMEPSDVPTRLHPSLAAAAAEVASVVGLPWRFSDDDPTIPLIRLIARVAAREPGAGGPHTARLADSLRSR